MEDRHAPPDLNLSRFDDDFADAPVEERTTRDAVPDGKYQVNVDKVELTTAKSSGNPMLKWTLRIIAPSSVGRLLFRNNVMASRENIKWLKGDLHICGLDLQKVSDLPAELERLLDVKLEVVKRTKGESDNVYFNRRIVIDDAGAPPSDRRGGGPGGDDDLPSF